MTIWTIDLLVLLPMLLSLGALYFWIYRKKHEGRKFPFSDAVLRVPGQGLSRQLDDMSFDLAIYFGLIPLAPIIAYAIYLQYLVVHQRQLSSSVAILLFISAVAVTAYFVIQSVRLLNRRYYRKLGHAGEVAVGSALNELMLQGYHVFHDIQGDNEFNIDHLVVGPAGVFAVETKTKTKLKKGAQIKVAHKVTFDGNALYFPDNPDFPHKDFLTQAERGAKWASKWLTEAVGERVNAWPVLVMPGWFITIKHPGRVMVLNHKQLHELPRVIKQPLDKAAITRITYQIKQKCLHDNLVPGVLAAK
jgi:hypothetical protein